MAPRAAAIAWISALRRTRRVAAARASGLIGTGSGRVNSSTSAPASRSAPTMKSSSPATAPTSTLRRSMSFKPLSNEARSGSNAKAASSCSARTWRASLPRTARFA